MIHYKSTEAIELIKQSCQVVSKTLAEAAKFLKDGITTLKVDKMIEDFILSHGAKPSFKGYHGFPFATCISVNDTVVHGFPNNDILKIGDVVSIDVGVYKNNYHGDSAYTFIIGIPKEEDKLLAQRTKQSLLIGIEKLKIGNRIGDVSFAIQEATEIKYGYGVIRDLIGHGIGRHLHEDPQVPNVGKRGTGPKIKEGLVVAIEPMVALGTKDVYIGEDGWTVKTKNNKTATHYEHTVAVSKNGYQILSTFTDIENNIKQNPNLWNEM